jgi:hypothetical protein
MTRELRLIVGADEIGEKLEIESVQNRPHTSVRVIAWEDRWCWIDARSKLKSTSWTWEFTHQGRSLVPANYLIRAFEESVISAWPSGDTKKLKEIWSPLLASGPRTVTRTPR